MPDHVKYFNASNMPCDMIIGPCVCGAWHTLDYWKDKFIGIEQFVPENLRNNGKH